MHHQNDAGMLWKGLAISRPEHGSVHFSFSSA